jgi:hypothetical protein
MQSSALVRAGVRVLTSIQKETGSGLSANRRAKRGVGSGTIAETPAKGHAESSKSHADSLLQALVAANPHLRLPCQI